MKRTDRGQADGDRRPSRRAEPHVSGTSGADRGTTGAADAGAARDLAVGALIILAVGIGFAVVNALTILSDWPGVRPWEPWVWEGSSTAALAVLAWIPWAAGRLAPASRIHDGWRARLQLLAIHLGAALIWSLGHVLLMVALRHGVYALAEARYDYGDPVGRFVYELRKDLLSYTLFVGVFWAARALREAKARPLQPVSFDIRDGARLIRTPVGDILAVAAAGNYVEFVLADGRRPLMRVTLAAVESELAPYGFVRVHRGWLVNEARLTGLRPDGSGDWTVELGALQVGASRRYADAIRRLRDR